MRIRQLGSYAMSLPTNEDLSSLPDPGPTARALALDFVEQRLGQFYAHENWSKLGPEGPKWVKLWLESAGYSPRLTEQVVDELNRLFNTRQAWPNGFDL